MLFTAFFILLLHSLPSFVTIESMIYKYEQLQQQCTACNRLLDIQCFRLNSLVCVSCNDNSYTYPPGEKQCGLCDLVKPYVAFHRDNYTSDGFRKQCKACVRHRARRTPESIEIIRKRTEVWNLANPDWIKQPRPKPKPRKGKPSRELRKRAKRAKRDLLPNYMTHLINWYGGACANHNCIYELTDWNTVSHDHVVPLTKGGAHTYENAQLLCRRCNSSKNNYHSTDYRNGPVLTRTVLDSLCGALVNVKGFDSSYLPADYAINVDMLSLHNMNTLTQISHENLSVLEFS